MTTAGKAKTTKKSRGRNNGSATEAKKAKRAKAVYTLNKLAAMSSDELQTLYEAGTVTASLEALTGRPDCRMLAVRGPAGRGPVADLLRAFAKSHRFPWAGKSFDAVDDENGEGINRVRLLGLRNWFPFKTRFEPSAVDGKPCILLDYALPENPWAIRHIRDELREVSPGVFLGPAMWENRGKATTILFFAVDNSSAKGS